MRTMYDSTDVMTLPPGADLYAGYDDGSWPDADAIAARFPGKLVVRVTTNPADNVGQVLDVERGDAKPTDAPGWCARARARGQLPTVYCSLSTWPIVRRLFGAGAEPAWWVAAYPGCGASLYPGTVAHQYASAPGYDTSVAADYWPGVDPAVTPEPVPPPAPEPVGEEDMQLYVTNSAGTGFIVAADLTSKRGVPNAKAAATLQATGLYKIVPQGELTDGFINSIPNAS